MLRYTPVLIDAHFFPAASIYRFCREREKDLNKGIIVGLLFPEGGKGGGGRRRGGTDLN